MGHSYIKSVDIWNALKNTKWTNAKDLELYQMIDDILNTNNDFFDDYVKREFNKIKREVDLEEESIL